MVPGAVGQPFAQRGARGAAERDNPPAVALAVADHELARALGQAHVVDLKRGELADPNAGEHQQLHDRAIAT